MSLTTEALEAHVEREPERLQLRASITAAEKWSFSEKRKYTICTHHVGCLCSKLDNCSAGCGTTGSAVFGPCAMFQAKQYLHLGYTPLLGALFLGTMRNAQALQSLRGVAEACDARAKDHITLEELCIALDCDVTDVLSAQIRFEDTEVCTHTLWRKYRSFNLLRSMAGLCFQRVHYLRSHSHYEYPPKTLNFVEATVVFAAASPLMFRRILDRDMAQSTPIMRTLSLTPTLENVAMQVQLSQLPPMCTSMRAGMTVTAKTILKAKARQKKAFEDRLRVQMNRRAELNLVRYSQTILEKKMKKCRACAKINTPATWQIMPCRHLVCADCRPDLAQEKVSCPRCHQMTDSVKIPMNDVTLNRWAKEELREARYRNNKKKRNVGKKKRS
jgi:hypothetical protein